MSTKEKIQEQEDVSVLEQETNQYEIVLYNDEVNTFDFVIDALVTVCEHSLIQAEQCTILVHYKGKCAVKTGDMDELKQCCKQLQSLGLSAVIE
jgi:ATP-dependent Clp protease adaptor protein ClpS